jgi:hypothetical protein
MSAIITNIILDGIEQCITMQQDLSRTMTALTKGKLGAIETLLTEAFADERTLAGYLSFKGK